MEILVMNCSSSSLGYQLTDTENEDVLARELCERIDIDGSPLTHTPAGGEKYKVEAATPNHKKAIELVMQAPVDPSHGAIKSTDEIPAVGHRVVHGGVYYSESVLANEDVKKAVADCFGLAPSHSPANLMGIEACEVAMSGKPDVAVFDTAFGMGMPERVYLRALSCEYYEKYKVCCYGFHGTGHNFVVGEAIRKDGLDSKSAKVVVCHLSNGISVSALIGGRCADASMGPTSLEGLIMGTRSDDIDSVIIQSIREHEKPTVEKMTDVLNKRSGVLGSSNDIFSDFRDIDDAANGGNHFAKAALEAYTLRVARCIGACVAVMNGVDAVAFMAGAGENDKFMRKSICVYLGHLGVKIDDERDNAHGEKRLISTDDSKMQVYLLPTNEGLAIVRDTLRLAK